jgi:hypothetical protein
MPVDCNSVPVIRNTWKEGETNDNHERTGNRRDKGFSENLSSQRLRGGYNTDQLRMPRNAKKINQY